MVTSLIRSLLCFLACCLAFAHVSAQPAPPALEAVIATALSIKEGEPGTPAFAAAADSYRAVLGEAQRMVMPLRATWLRRALRNLVSNALRYGSRARVTLRREDNEAVLVVEDDGPGIPEHEIARMLEPFTRLEASRNSATGGAGLGLTLARAIADQHAGSLVLANRQQGGETKGLTATLRLPLQ